MHNQTVILGVAASDAHVVANHLISFMLREKGYNVVNLGATTTIEEFVEAYQANPDTKAILIGSHNGHAFEDLKPLKEAKETGLINCPVIVGGNLSVGSEKSGDMFDRLKAVGVDLILQTHDQILSALGQLVIGRAQAARMVS